MEVKVGQIWIDNDKRFSHADRHLRVELVDGQRAKCWSYYNNEVLGRFAWIRLDRFRRTASGYRLETDVPPQSAEYIENREMDVTCEPDEEATAIENMLDRVQSQYPSLSRDELRQIFNETYAALEAEYIGED